MEGPQAGETLRLSTLQLTNHAQNRGDKAWWMREIINPGVSAWMTHAPHVGTRMDRVSRLQSQAGHQCRCWTPPRLVVVKKGLAETASVKAERTQYNGAYFRDGSL